MLKGSRISDFRDDQVVGVIKFHPDDSNLFLSGGSKGRLRLWDVRTGKVVHEYIRSLGPILMLNSPLMGSNFPVTFPGVTSVKIPLLFGTSLDRFHCLMRFMQKPTLVLVLGTIHSIPILWPNQMGIILPFSLQTSLQARQV
ncbi:hypothetical protein E1A91_D01G078700v1 [Gossypium mustelinum]|uniref:Uncharacterized protein n=1 Tax=Gossypium mustelinum TaxID=34275 RepID=A0A5D2W4F2_GOSMU|nr:hypothetical protein E1A91_D01G078700v1 [Gossypium mustelinum]